MHNDISFYSMQQRLHIIQTINMDKAAVTMTVQNCQT